MFDLLAPQLASANLFIVLAISLAAGLARGFSGFGAALIFVPLVSSVLGPNTAVPLLLVVDGLMTIGMIPGAVRLANHRDVLTMAVGAFVGVPVGIYLLTSLDPIVVRWTIFCIVVALLSLLISGWRYHRKPRATLTVFVGMIAGVFSGVAQIGGPPVVAYWLGGTVPRAVVRANLVFYFAISTVLTGAGYIWNGLITPELLLLAAFVAPTYGVGLWLGSRMFGLATDEVFRRICFLMIALAAFASMPIFDGVKG